MKIISGIQLRQDFAKTDKCLPFGKTQAYKWICRDFTQVLDAQEIGAGRVRIA